MPPPETLMPSQASCTTIRRHCLTIAKRVPIHATPSKMRLWGPWASFSPHRPRFWNTSVDCNTPTGTIMSRPCEGERRFPVLLRSVHSSIRSLPADSIQCFSRSLSAWNSTTCWRIGAAWIPNAWWPWMGRITFRPKPCMAAPVSPAHGPMGTLSLITPPLPR